jgi:hypothetical protein
MRTDAVSNPAGKSELFLWRRVGVGCSSEEGERRGRHRSLSQTRGASLSGVCLWQHRRMTRRGLFSSLAGLSTIPLVAANTPQSSALEGLGTGPTSDSKALSPDPSMSGLFYPLPPSLLLFPWVLHTSGPFPGKDGNAIRDYWGYEHTRHGQTIRLRVRNRNFAIDIEQDRPLWIAESNITYRKGANSWIDHGDRYQDVDPFPGGIVLGNTSQTYVKAFAECYCFDLFDFLDGAEQCCTDAPMFRALYREGEDFMYALQKIGYPDGPWKPLLGERCVRI